MTAQPTACATRVPLSYLAAMTHDTPIHSLQFAEGFMDSLPQPPALETPEKFVSLCSLYLKSSLT